jgi:hypothetical protein
VRLTLYRCLNSYGVFVPEYRWELLDWYLLATVITVIRSTRTRWVGDKKTLYEILIGKPKMWYSLGDARRYGCNI